MYNNLIKFNNEINKSKKDYYYVQEVYDNDDDNDDDDEDMLDVIRNTSLVYKNQLEFFDKYKLKNKQLFSPETSIKQK